ncbi:MAG: hypothetical protein ACE5KD_04085 [Candidatus Bathyarchaeia archaeon]
MRLQKKLKIENLHETNIEDLIYVCSSKRLNDPIHQQGMSLKREWLQEMLRKYGSCAKIAYYNQKPAAQILYFPEEADKIRISRRKTVLVINCIYNPTPEAQKLGLGKKLLKSVIEDAKQEKTCLSNKCCKFVLAKAFNTGELLSLPKFYEKYGFTPIPEGEENLLYLPIHGSYEPVAPVGEYEPLEEDKGKAIVFYSPVCQFSYQFAKTIENTIMEVAPNMKIEIINEWKSQRNR